MFYMKNITGEITVKAIEFHVNDAPTMNFKGTIFRKDLICNNINRCISLTIFNEEKLVRRNCRLEIFLGQYENSFIGFDFLVGEHG